MSDWREIAKSEIADLKPYYVKKHDWKIETAEHDDHLDLFVSMTGGRLENRRYVLRLRYQSDWQTAGRREAFVDPEDYSTAGSKFWPAEGTPPRLIEEAPLNPRYRPNGVQIPVICLRGVWGYHSVLHTDQSAEGHSLLRFLVELQEVLDG